MVISRSVRPHISFHLFLVFERSNFSMAPLVSNSCDFYFVAGTFFFVKKVDFAGNHTNDMICLGCP